MSWTQPFCDTCYAGCFPTNPAPVRFKIPEDETCCVCGKLTNSGIYARIDPKTVPHPQGD